MPRFLYFYLIIPFQSDLNPCQKSTLFICKSCHYVENRPADRPTNGQVLLDQINALSTEHSDVATKAVGCLWTCGQSYSAAFSRPYKLTVSLGSGRSPQPKYQPMVGQEPQDTAGSCSATLPEDPSKSSRHR
ncbi:MAG: DUF1636 family protein [Oscillatoriales cyanobacterium SM2_1_8]|nr:DUF1636 family protein [Oscillatoriales cyanobacterium SM2_1_8]